MEPMTLCARRKTFWLMAAAMAAIALACLAGCASAGGGQGSAQLRQESYPLLIQGYDADDESGGEGASSPDGAPSGDEGPDLTQINLYFVGDGDVPYVSVSEFMPLFGALYKSEGTQIPAAEYDIAQEGAVTTVTRADNEAVLKVDAGKDALAFSDFDLFMQSPGNSSLLNLVTTGDTGVGGTSNLLKVAGETYSRMRGPIELDLAAYSIDVVEKDGECYLPLQTAADVFLGRVLACAVFNGEKVFVFNDGGYFADDIRSVPAGQMSEGFARFNYDELRFLLDTFYGLKPQHDIADFESLFEETGLKEGLSSTDPAQFDAALDTLVSVYLDDLHSAYNGPSYLEGAAPDGDAGGGSGAVGEGGAGDSPMDLQGLEDYLTGESMTSGESTVKMLAAMAAYSISRAQVNPGLEGSAGANGLFSYEEVGDTAIITFDSFLAAKDDYYADADLDDPQDTIELVAAAHRRITREGSPVKNVVIDLSCNGGGQADTAAFIAA